MVRYFSDIGISITNRRGGGAWSPASIESKLLYWGKISEISGGEMPNKVTGATDHITVGGSVGSYTFQVPNTAPYIAADTDYIWFKTDETQRTTTEAELVGYDLPRTPVKYDDASPNSIREILILKAGEVLTAGEMDFMHSYMRLPIMWDGTFSDLGYEKSNRPLEEQYLWTPEIVITYDEDAIDLINRMIAVGETPSGAYQDNLNATIVALKAEGLFDTQWDVFVPLRGIGEAGTKLNWIKNTHNAIPVLGSGGVLTYTEKVGYHSDGSKSYIDTDYIPSTQGVLFTLDDASFLMKISGTLGTGFHGTNMSATIRGTVISDGYTRINNTNLGILGWGTGYNCVTALGVNEARLYRGATDSGALARDMVAITVGKPYIFSLNGYDSPFTYTPSTHICELYAFGKGISKAKYDTFRTIMDTYFNNL